MANLIPKIKDNTSGQLSAVVQTSSKTYLLKSGEGANFPQPKNGAADSAGDATTLNSSGIQDAGVEVEDVIVNLTDSDPVNGRFSFAVVTAVTTDSVTTTPLRGGTANTWADEDDWVVDPFVVNLSKRDGSVLSGAITAYEKVLITERTTDTLKSYAVSGFRGYDGTSIQAFANSDFVTIEQDQSFGDGIKALLTSLFSNPIATLQLIDNFSAQNIAGVKVFTDAPQSTATPSADNDLVTKAFLLANLGGGGEVTKTLDGSCSAAQRLYVKPNGNFAGATAAAKTQETSLKTVGSLTQCWSVKVADDRWVKIYATASQAYAQAGTYDASGNWVGGTEVNFFSGTVSFVSACKQGDDEGVIYVQNGTAAKLFHFTVADSPSTHTLTVGSAQNGPTGLLAGTSRRRHKIVRLTDTTFACGTFKSGATGFFLGTNSGGTLSLSAFHQHSTFASAHDYPGDICRVDDTHILFASYYADGVGSVRGKVYDVSNQASPSQSAPASGFYSFGASNNAWCTFDEVGADGDNLVAGWHSYGNEGLWEISGSSITSKGSWTSPSETSLDHYNEGNGVFKVADNVWGCTGTSSVSFFGWNGSSVDSLGSFSYGETATGAVMAEGLGICHIDATDAEAIVGSYDTTAYANFLANEAQTDGNQIKGIGAGGILDSETGLTVGVNYIIDGETWGQTLSETEVFVTKTVS